MTEVAQAYLLGVIVGIILSWIFRNLIKQGNE